MAYNKYLSAASSDQMVEIAWHYIERFMRKQLRQGRCPHRLLMSGMDTGLGGGGMYVKYLALMGHIQKLKQI